MSERPTSHGRAKRHFSLVPVCLFWSCLQTSVSLLVMQRQPWKCDALCYSWTISSPTHQLLKMLHGINNNKKGQILRILFRASIGHVLQEQQQYCVKVAENTPRVHFLLQWPWAKFLCYLRSQAKQSSSIHPAGKNIIHSTLPNVPLCITTLEKLHIIVAKNCATTFVTGFLTLKGCFI